MIPREKEVAKPDDDFQQRPFELSRPSHPKVDPRAGKGLLSNLKKSLGMRSDDLDSIEERSVGLNSMGGVRRPRTLSTA